MALKRPFNMPGYAHSAEMKRDQRIWIGFVSILVLLALGLWWVAAHERVDTSGLADTRPAEVASPAPSDQAAAPVATVERKRTTVYSIVANLSGASQFRSLLRTTGVMKEIEGAGPYTVFVPTSGAFARVPISISGLPADDEERLAAYHVIVGTAVDVDAETNGSLPALSGDTLNFSYGLEHVPMVNSSVVVQKYDAKNGVVYVIDTVLLPPKKAGE